MFMDVNMRAVLSISLIFLILEWTQAAGVIKTPPKSCRDPNAEVTFCPNPCPLSCDNLAIFESIRCLKKCPFKGCTCKTGYVVGPNGLCILQTECSPEFISTAPKTCLANEQYNPCPKYCAFDVTCQIVLDGFLPSCPPPPPNLQACIPRCECISNYVRINGVCVPRDKCCNDDNAMVVPCPMDCNPTCSGPAPPGCIVNCIISGCKCKAGFVKGPFDTCIAPQECLRT